MIEHGTTETSHRGFLGTIVGKHKRGDVMHAHTVTIKLPLLPFASLSKSYTAMARATRSSMKGVGPSDKDKWVRKVESIGIELKARGSRWDEINRVLEMLCEINHFDDNLQWMEILSLDTPSKRKKFQADLNSCDPKIVRSDISINNVRLSVFYEASKTTYEDIRERHEKMVANNNGVPMATWTDGPAKAWLDAAKLVTIRGRCYPEESEEDNFKNAMRHMERSLKKESDVKLIVDRYIEDTNRFMTWSALDRCVGPMQKIPHPVWPEDEDKQLDLLRFPTVEEEDAFLEKLLAFIELRITNLFAMEGYDWPPLAVDSNGLVQVCQIRKFSRTLLTRNDKAVWLEEWASYEHITAGTNKPEMIEVLLVHFSKLLTIGEAINDLDAFRTMASKDQAMALSRKPLDEAQLLNMERFKTRHLEEWEKIKRHIFFWRLRKGSGPWKRNEIEALVSAQEKAARSEKTYGEYCLDRVGVSFDEDEGRYCCYLPKPFAGKHKHRASKESGFLELLSSDYNGQDLLETLWGGTGNFALDDIEQVLCDNPEFSDHKEDAECAPFFNVIARLKEFKEGYSAVGEVDKAEFEHFHELSKELIEEMDQAMDKPLKKLQKLASKGDLKWPKLVQGCSHIIRFDAPGAVWRINKSLARLQEFFSFCLKLMLNLGILNDDSWGIEEDDRGISDDTLCMITANILCLHRPSMGGTMDHYTEGFHSWMSPICGSGAVMELAKMLFKIIRAHTDKNFEPKDLSPVTETFEKCYKTSTKATATYWKWIDAVTAEYIKSIARSTTKKEGTKRRSSSPRNEAAKKTKTAEPKTPAGRKRRAAKKTMTAEPKTPAQKSSTTPIVSPPAVGDHLDTNVAQQQARQDSAAVEAASEKWHVSI